jgi:ABC-2 type transport system ATP-binding protein
MATSDKPKDEERAGTAEDPTILPGGPSAPAPRKPMVQARGLVKNYADVCAVSGISFDVPEGEVFGFIGPNGAGKTTTLRILATLLEPTAGQVIIDGLCVEDETEDVRRIVGYMPDHFGLYEGITVEEYLEFFAAAYRLPASRRPGILRDVMALTDLGPLKDRMVSTLSRGMKQRVCLAKTLVHDPKVLILDEPAASLDARARIEMRALLKELGRMGKTIIISSHILTELSGLCSSVAIIEKGRLVACGEVDLLERKQWEMDRVKITLSKPWPEMEALLSRIPDVAGVEVDPSGATFEYRGDPAHFHRVIQALAVRDAPLWSVEHESRNLEDLFLKLTKGDLQ